jgi:hypothetical protein
MKMKNYSKKIVITVGNMIIQSCIKRLLFHYFKLKYFFLLFTYLANLVLYSAAMVDEFSCI